ncbi:MAG: AarF/UbiB family protein [Gammaproteobacteria bacterium]|nr:AarF/UbiB family protein [Gammaproteobacteria bacterium]
MIKETLSAARDLGRLHEIASVLIRWGFGDMVRRLGMRSVLERAGKALHLSEDGVLSDLEPPERVLRVLQELGPTFVKLGQVLSTRIDLFPPDWIEAFERLQDDVASLPYEQIAADIRQALGDEPDNLFAKFEKQAFAAASIAQVHKAVLMDGSEVVLKVRRPHIAEQIEKDLRLLARLAEIAENNIEELKRYNPSEIVRQFNQSLHRELDLQTECHYAERIAKNLNDEHIVIPKVYWQWTSESLNAQAFIHGIRGRDLDRLNPPRYDKKIIALRGANAVLSMIIDDGFFHADPHLGNLLILPHNKIAFIDFGMVGRLSDERRDEITDLLYALVKKKPRGVMKILLVWNEQATADETRLLDEIDQFLDRYHGLSLKQLDFASLLRDLVRIIRENELVLPPDLALLFKTFIALEGVGRKLDPEFNIVEVATPFLSRAIQKRYRPDALLRRGASEMVDMANDFAELPREAKELLKALRRGGLQVNIDMTRLDHFGHQIDRAASRLTLGIVIAALIIGTAIVTATTPETTILGLPAWGMVGFIAAILGGFALLISIWRGGRD